MKIKKKDLIRKIFQKLMKKKNSENPKYYNNKKINKN